MKTLDDLRQSVAEVPQVTIHEIASGYPFIRVSNAFAKADIALHGAHLTSFLPKGSSEVIFLSSNAQYQAGTAIRGGIPICWPWFSRHPQQPDLPSHGIARTSFWDLRDVNHSGDHTQVVMSLNTDGNDPRWPYASLVEVCFNIGATLNISLTTLNADSKPLQFSDALHCYFRVGDAERTEVEGLDGCKYVYRMEDTEPKTQTEPIIINRPIDRIFQSSRCCSILDGASNRVIVLGKSGSGNTVVWNPGAEGATRIADLANDEYREFVCVEQANTHPAPITLEPGSAHATQVSIAVSAGEK